MRRRDKATATRRNKSGWDRAPTLLVVVVPGMRKPVAYVKQWTDGPYWLSSFDTDPRLGTDDPRAGTVRALRQPVDPARVNGLWDEGYIARADGIGTFRIPVQAVSDALAAREPKLVHHL